MTEYLAPILVASILTLIFAYIIVRIIARAFYDEKWDYHKRLSKSLNQEEERGHEHL